MVVGYALGNRNDQEDEIQVLGEDEPNVITFSKSLNITLSKLCNPNPCDFCRVAESDVVTVPYSTIKLLKDARAQGIREVNYYTPNRLDNYGVVNAELERWGFNSYKDYLYTICELGFLEGLIPVLQVGFLTPQEIKALSEIVAIFNIPLTTPDDFFCKTKLAKERFNKELLIRKKLLDWTGKLNLPSYTGFVADPKMSKTMLNNLLEYISDIYKSYGSIHTVHFKLYPEGGPKSYSDKERWDALHNCIEIARSKLPEEVFISAPISPVKYLDKSLKKGMNDLGPLSIEESDLLYETEYIEFFQKIGKLPQHRFPLNKQFIKAERYSKKLGQVFEAYRYKIKKQEQEKIKESKAANS